MTELDSIVTRVDGHYERKTWYLGSSDALGQEVDGWSGKEILVKKPVIRPAVIFEVKAGERK